MDQRPWADVVVVVAVYFILSRLLYLAYSTNVGLLCMPHPGMGPLVSRHFRRTERPKAWAKAIWMLA